MDQPRVVIFAGHYGSGKTNLAVNWAICRALEGGKVVLADLDIVNPYFRTSDSRDILERHGVTLIASDFAGSNVDLPSVPSRAGIIFDDTSVCGVVDVGGDDRGALALGRYAARIRAEDCGIFLVVNMFRPETGDAGGCVRIKDEIEAASRVRFTGIVNNSNLGAYTGADDVLSSADYAESIAAATGLPLAFTSARRDICPELEARLPDVFPIDLTVKAEWAF